MGRVAAVQISRQPADTFLAQVQLSQLLFDFGKSLAATDAARKLAEVAVASSPAELEALGVRTLGKKGELTLILRGIGIELRMHLEGTVWRGFFDGCFERG